jgi:hypothetical protein
MSEIVKFPHKGKSLGGVGCAAQPINEIIAAGQSAWARLNQHESWRNWVAVGKALNCGRAEAMRVARTKQPIGRRYSLAFSDWLGRNGFAGISKSTRARLFECIDNIEEIEAWRATLKPTKLIRLNHPTTVLSAWRRANEPTDKPADAPMPPVSAIRKLIDRLSEADREALVGEILCTYPKFLPPDLRDLRDQLLRQQQDRRHDGLTLARVAKNARKISALCSHPEQNVDDIRRAAAEIQNAVEPRAAKPAVVRTPTIDLTAWSRAMSLPVTTEVQ